MLRGPLALILLLRSMGSLPVHGFFPFGRPLPLGVNRLNRGGGGSLAGGGRADDDLVCGGWNLEGGWGSLGCDFPGTSFPDRPSIRLRRLVEGFLLKPISACEEVLWRSSLAKLGSPMSPRGSSDRSNWSNAPNSSSDWFNSMTCSSPSSLPSSVSAACGVESPSGKKKPCSATVIF